MAGQPTSNPARMVNLERCPIDDPDSAGGAAFSQACRKRFLEEGLCMLPGFIWSEALENLAEEANGCIGDPLGACSVNVFVDGGEHGWHFDESEFTGYADAASAGVGGLLRVRAPNPGA